MNRTLRDDLANRIALAVLNGETPNQDEVDHYADLVAQEIAETVDLDRWIAERNAS